VILQNGKKVLELSIKKKKRISNKKSKGKQHLTGLFTHRRRSASASIRLGQSLRSFPRLIPAHLGGRSLLHKALVCPPKRRKQPNVMCNTALNV
jgi:hypothetical protein